VNLREGRCKQESGCSKSGVRLLIPVEKKGEKEGYIQKAELATKEISHPWDISTVRGKGAAKLRREARRLTKRKEVWGKKVKNEKKDAKRAQKG